MFEFDANEAGDLRLTTARAVGSRHFRFVMVVTRDVWEGFLGANAPDAANPTARDAYEKARGFWETALQEIADQETFRLDVANAVETHTFFPSLDWLEKRRQAASA